jgi:hypothetical protein
MRGAKVAGMVTRAAFGLILVTALGCLPSARSYDCVYEGGAGPTTSGEFHFAPAFDAPTLGAPERPWAAGLEWAGDDHVLFSLEINVNNVSPQRPLDIQTQPFSREPGVHDLGEIGARACYCPDAHPAWDPSSLAIRCVDEAGGTSVERTCEALTGTLTVVRFSYVCGAPPSYGNADHVCVTAYDVTLDVPRSAGRVWAHVHAVSSDTLEHFTCTQPSDW